MLDSAVRKYKEVRATTSTPGELLLALYDGLFRFLNAGKLCFTSGQAARGREQLSHAHAILSELYIALDHEAAPELCAQLSGVYGFCMDSVRRGHPGAGPAARGVEDRRGRDVTQTVGCGRVGVWRAPRPRA
jgi:flagellar biosynthetic protein FliS